MSIGAVGDMSERKDRPAYVRFDRLAVEDVLASAKAGHYVARDVDYALVTPAYSRDVFKSKVTSWLPELRRQANEGKIPQEWLTHYEAAYQAFQKGQAVPLTGTPIKGWGMISPAQQETLVQLMVLTVEDLAAMNAEGMRVIGMGAMALRDKAQAWLSQLHDKGPLTQEIAMVKAENVRLTGEVSLLTRQVQELRDQLRAVPNEPIQAAADEITLDDILPEESVIPISRPSKKKG